MTLSHMRAVAEAATPGPWLARHYPDCLPLVKLPTDEIQDIPTDEDAQFIATFNPAVVLKLLAVVEAAERLGVEDTDDFPEWSRRVARALAGLEGEV